MLCVAFPRPRALCAGLPTPHIGRPHGLADRGDSRSAISANSGDLRRVQARRHQEQRRAARARCGPTRSRRSRPEGYERGHASCAAPQLQVSLPGEQVGAYPPHPSVIVGFGAGHSNVCHRAPLSPSATRPDPFRTGTGRQKRRGAAARAEALQVEHIHRQDAWSTPCVMARSTRSPGARAGAP